MVCWESVILQFDAASGHLCTLARRVDGRQFIQGAGRPVVEMVVLDSQHHRRRLVPGQLQEAVTEVAGLTLTFAPVAGIAVQVEVRPADGSQGLPATDADALVWQVQVDNRSDDLTVVEVLFPCLRGIAPAPAGGVDYLLFPHHAGEKTADPRTTYRTPRYLNFSRAATVKESERFYVREIPYCGLASMMWMDYYDSLGGIYLASYDPEFLLTGLRVEIEDVRGGQEDVAGDAGSSQWTLGLAFRKYVPIPPGCRWRSPPAVVWLHEGDWHEPARHYRAWFDAHGRPGRLGGRDQSDQSDRADSALVPTPPDLASEPVVTPWYELRREEGVLHRFAELPGIYDDVAAGHWGSRHLFLAGWNRGGFDSQYPEYQPDLDLGSPVELRRVVQHVEGRGGMVTFYINSRLFDRNSYYHPTLGEAWAIRSESGESHTETYGPVTFDVCCPAHEDWRRHLADFAEWMVTAYGARGIYFDQLGSATPFACYNHGHTHYDHHGLYNQGYVELLEETIRRLRRTRPDAFLMIENCGDLYSSRVYGSLVWNGTPYDEFFRLFKYTFPEFTLVQMIQPRTALPPAVRLRQFHRDLDETWLLGSVFWIHPPRVEKPIGMSADEAAMVMAEARAALGLRRAVASLLARARFVDTDGLQAEWQTMPQPGGARDVGEYASHWLIDSAVMPGLCEHLVLAVPAGVGRRGRQPGSGAPASLGVEVAGCRRWHFRRLTMAPGAADVDQREGELEPDDQGLLRLDLDGADPARGVDRSDSAVGAHEGAVWQAWHLRPVPE